MSKKKDNNKGFTLIELIVVMAVIGVLVLLAMPKFMGFTQKARLTEIKSNIKQLESASERYYMDKQEWPRLSDVPYTKAQLESFAKEIKDKTGQTITLDFDGKYYAIDYDKLQKYVQKPKDSINYIIQNPLGEVFYLEGLTDEGKSTLSLNNETTNPENPEPEPSPEGWFIIDVSGAVKASDALKVLPNPIDLVIPSSVNGQIVTSIAANGFYGLQNITSVVIPNTVVTIGNSAFRGNTNLKNITIPNGVKTIETLAFIGDKSLTEMILPDSVTAIRGSAFDGCTSLTKIVLPKNLTLIDDYTFRGIKQVSIIEIPASVTRINQYAFNGWTSSQSIIFKPRNNTNITINTGWSGSAQIVFEDADDYFVIDAAGAVGINNAFKSMVQPIDLTIPNSINGQTVTSIATNGFYGLQNITSVVIPNTVVTIGNSAFRGNINLKNITIPNGVKTIEPLAFIGDKSLAEIILPDSVTTIRGSAFDGCTSLTRIVLPKNLILIDDYTFRDTKQVSIIEIPASVTRINQYAFSGWTSTQSIVFVGRSDSTGLTLNTGWKGLATVVYQP